MRLAFFLYLFHEVGTQAVINIPKTTLLYIIQALTKCVLVRDVNEALVNLGYIQLQSRKKEARDDKA
jgi:hypothetical protein